MMRAAWYDRVGAPRDVLTVGELPIPEVGDGEVRVRVHVSLACKADAVKRAGMLGPMPFPRIIPHTDGAGTVEAVGANVRSVAPGDRVWMFNAQAARAFGTAADYVVLDQNDVVPLPESVNYLVGSCLGTNGRIAHGCVFSGGPVRGKTLLVSGGISSVGMYSIELAKWGGATVIVTVSSDQQVDAAYNVGADYVINTMTEDVAGRIDNVTGRHGVDRIIGGAMESNIALEERVLATEGTIATWAIPQAAPAVSYWSLVFKSAPNTFITAQSPPEQQARVIADLLTCAELGLLRPLVALRVPLKDIAHAHEAIERGANGKVFVDLVAERQPNGVQDEFASREVRSASA